MNSLSLFLYAADVLRGLQGFLGFLSFFMMFTGAGLIALSFVYDELETPKDGAKYSWEVDKKIVYPLTFLKWVGIPVLSFGFIFALIAIAIPTKDTMYMIAASQVGEQIIQLEEVKNIGGEVGGLASDTIELLRQNIQDQLTQKPTEGSK